MITLKLDLAAMERLFESSEAKIELQRCVTNEFVRRHFQKVALAGVDTIFALQHNAIKRMIEESIASHVGEFRNKWTKGSWTFTPEQKNAIDEYIHKSFEAFCKTAIAAASEAYRSDIAAAVKSQLDYDVRQEVDKQVKAKPQLAANAIYEPVERNEHLYAVQTYPNRRHPDLRLARTRPYPYTVGKPGSNDDDRMVGRRRCSGD